MRLFFEGTPGTLKQIQDLVQQRVLTTLGGLTIAAVRPEAPASSELQNFDTTFHGREQDLRDLCHTLTVQNRGLVTIHATSGMGKSRLAIEVARTLRDHHGYACYFVKLENQQSITGICNAVAYELRANLDQPGEPPRLVADLLRQLPVSLLVLDGFEHLMAHAPQTVGVWRGAAPQVKILVTSQRDLGLGGEQLYPLRPLVSPSRYEVQAAEQTMNFTQLLTRPAVRLFVETARSQDPAFNESTAPRVVVELCLALQGLPLQIILAAKTVKYQTLEEMLQEMHANRRPPGSQTLMETIGRSYRLLGLLAGGSQGSAVQEAFKQACIFRDGFSRKAARAVLHVPGYDVLDLVEKLCSFNLLQADLTGPEARYRMFPAIQAFGQHLWSGDVGTPPDDQAPEAPAPPLELARRWANYFLRYAQGWNGRIHSPDCIQALERLVRERENILGAHTWALHAGETATAGRLILAYARALELRGPWPERVHHLSQTLNVCGDPPERVRLWVELARAHWDQGDFTAAMSCASEAEKEAVGLGDPAVYALAQWEKGERAHFCGHNEGAIEMLKKAIEDFDGLGDRVSCAVARCRLAYIHARFGNFPQALTTLKTALQDAEQSGSPIASERVCHRLGWFHWFIGEPGEAERWTRESQKLCQELGGLRGAGTNLSLILTDLDRFEEALDCVRPEIGTIERAWLALAIGSRGRIQLLQGHLGRAETDLRKALQLARLGPWQEDQAFHLGNLGLLLLRGGRQGEYDEAADCLREAADIHRKIDKCDEGGHRRFWSNLVNLAEAERRRGNASVVAPLVAQAVALAERLGLGEDHCVRLVREDAVLLRELKGK